MIFFTDFCGKIICMYRLKFFSGTLILSSVILICSGWGFLVHRTVAQLAVYQLPKKMRLFFYKNINYLVKESVRPDLRRNGDPTENAKHFIDLEMYGDSAEWKMPLHWEDAVKIYTKDTLLKYGYVPYVVIMQKNKLTEAFRNGNKDSILFYATDLGHYIGDAHVPLHSSANYDGQLTNQKGLHNLWETMIPEMEIDKYDLYNHHEAKYISNPEEAIWNAVRSGHDLLTNVFAMEKEASKNFTDSAKYRVQIRNGKEFKSYTSSFAKTYSELLGKSINEQLLRSSNLIADFWYTSWADAGKPDLEKLLSNPFVKKDKKDLKQQCKAYRKNELIEKKLLISKENKDASN
jgi:S1/P1 nuclease